MKAMADPWEYVRVVVTSEGRQCGEALVPRGCPLGRLLAGQQLEPVDAGVALSWLQAIVREGAQGADHAA